MPNPKNLDLAVSQVQESLGLANMLDLKNLDLKISQTQGNAKKLGLGSQLSSHKCKFNKHVRPKNLYITKF